MTENELKLYKICKTLELYEGYTKGIMNYVDNEEDVEAMLKFYDKHRNVNESDFLGYATYLHIKRTDPDRIVEQGKGDVEIMID